MKKLLGDIAADCTKAVGAPPCEGCKKRQEKLNEWGRRTFLGRGVTALAVMMMPRVPQALKESNLDAVKLLRFLNTAQRWHQEYEGQYADLPKLMTGKAVAELATDKYAEEHGIGATFITKLTPNAPEILADWVLEFKQSGMKYAAHVKSTTTSAGFSTDESAIISEHQPTIGWFKGLFFRCIGADWKPGCCCQFPCCDQCSCDQTCRYNCGCRCCVWCCTPNC